MINPEEGLVNEEDVQAATLIEGFMHRSELEWLSGIALQARSIVEVGSAHGRSARVLARAGYLTCVDVKFAPDFDENLAGFHVVKLEMSSRDAIGQLRKADVVFLDGDHSEEMVAWEMEAYGRIVAPGGLLCGHDAWCEGVRRARERVLPDCRFSAESIWWVRK